MPIIYSRPDFDYNGTPKLEVQMFKRKSALIACLLLTTACTSGTDALGIDTFFPPEDAVDDNTPLDVVADIAAPETLDGDIVVTDIPGLHDFVKTDVVQPLPDLVPVDIVAEIPTPQCDPGEGCFLDPCTENGQCQSGWCVEHMGDGVCSQLCEEECPPGWTCKQVGAGGPDVVYICVSDFSNLCKPCATTAGCKAVGNAEDVCVDYGHEGAFCGGACTAETGCPWGFSCAEVTTVEGVILQQCVADAGVCPCTNKSVALGLTTPCQTSNDFGTCAGKRVCTEDGLSHCDAGQAQAESCNGLDDDCDGEVDEPDDIGGDYVNLCDDGNECTQDLCNGETGCDYLALDGDECKDGDPCTAADLCVQGICLGDPVVCEDGNPCTDDMCTETGGCDHVPNQDDCDDQAPCTLGDTCKAGECVGVQVPCDCQVDEDCEALEDGDVCNGTLLCNTDQVPFECVVDPDTVVTCPEPEGVDAPCLTPLCDPDSGECAFEPFHDGYPCDDQDPCTAGETCQVGQCLGGLAVNCNDGNICTDDVCESGQGCVYEDNYGPCEDGDICTLADSCDDGECQAGIPINCDDGNPCTDDSCDPLTGCVHTANDADCDDHNPCTVGDHCQNTVCTSSGIDPCNDGNLCTTDWCDPADGCQHSNNLLDCDDGDLCTDGEQCQDGLCGGGDKVLCDDNNLCTDDWCTPLGGCQYDPNDAPCDDGNLCTEDDTCALGKCAPGTPKDCADDNICTTDSCDPLTGCVATLNEAPCDDEDLCTTGDHCHLGGCIGGGQLTCDDGNICTDDSCNPLTGCQFDANQAPCDDSNECTVDDACLAGWCAPGLPKNCADSNDCTIDTCAPLAGCQYTDEADGTPCLDEGIEKICQGGQCVCKPDCQGKVCGPDGCGGSCGSCDDDDECTLNEQCVDGLCTHEILTCDDLDLCTDDTCDPGQGCVFTPNLATCNDNNPCTINDACSAGQCTGTPVPNLAPWQFTNASAAGRFGPSQGNTDSAYAGTTLQGQVLASGGIQAWQVPSTGTYTIVAAGAKGGDGGGDGSHPATEPGKGALVSGEFELEAGDTLHIVVGQMGALSLQNGWQGGGCSGGGGASFVYFDAQDDHPLIVGAGGGGHAEDGKGGHGSGDQNTTFGTLGSGNSGAGGTNGNGGSHGPLAMDLTPGSGGGGWLTDGEIAPTIRNPGGIGGHAPRNGAEGGFGIHDSFGPEHCSGGFGAGGAGADNTGAGGGGGGYNGGGGGAAYSGDSWGAGGGGGSYNSGANQSNQTGATDAHGYVTITYACN